MSYCAEASPFSARSAMLEGDEFRRPPMVPTGFWSRPAPLPGLAAGVAMIGRDGAAGEAATDGETLTSGAGASEFWALAGLGAATTFAAGAGFTTCD